MRLDWPKRRDYAGNLNWRVEGKNQTEYSKLVGLEFEKKTWSLILTN